MRIIRTIIIFLILFSWTLSSYAQDKEQRIVSLAPSTTEILFALGLEKNIVGVSTYCNWPPEVNSYPRAGSFSQANVEIITTFKPDIIFGVSLEQTPSVTHLQQLGFNVEVIDPKSIDELYQAIKKIGYLTDRQYRAEELVSEIKLRIALVKEKVAKIPIAERPKVFLELWDNPLLTTNVSSFVGELIETAGGRNIAYDAPREYSRFSTEVVIERNPDIIIMGHEAGTNAMAVLDERYGWDQINAVKLHQIYGDINRDLYLRPGPRIVEGIEALYEHFYPEK